MKPYHVDEIVLFTSYDNKVYEVNFRGYFEGGAVIVGKREDKIGQMKVELNQLAHKLLTSTTK